MIHSLESDNAGTSASATFFQCVVELSVMDQNASFSTLHQGSQGIGTSALIDHSPVVIGSQNEFLH